jgi:hypothetical protein
MVERQRETSTGESLFGVGWENRVLLSRNKDNVGHKQPPIARRREHRLSATVVDICLASVVRQMTHNVFCMHADTQNTQSWML